jgi:hypothetical protein
MRWVVGGDQDEHRSHPRVIQQISTRLLFIIRHLVGLGSSILIEKGHMIPGQSYLGSQIPICLSRANLNVFFSIMDFLCGILLDRASLLSVSYKI